MKIFPGKWVFSDFVRWISLGALLNGFSSIDSFNLRITARCCNNATMQLTLQWVNLQCWVTCFLCMKFKINLSQCSQSRRSNVDMYNMIWILQTKLSKNCQQWITSLQIYFLTYMHSRLVWRLKLIIIDSTWDVFMYSKFIVSDFVLNVLSLWYRAAKFDKKYLYLILKVPVYYWFDGFHQYCRGSISFRHLPNNEVINAI